MSQVFKDKKGKKEGLNRADIIGVSQLKVLRGPWLLLTNASDCVPATFSVRVGCTRLGRFGSVKNPPSVDGFYI